MGISKDLEGGSTISPQPSQGGAISGPTPQGGSAGAVGFFVRDNIEIVTENGEALANERNAVLVSYIDPGRIETGGGTISPDD